MSRKNAGRRSSRAYISVFLIFFIICFLIAVFSFQYYRKLSSTIRGESESYLQEVSRRIGSNIDRIVNDNYAVLHMMSATVETMGPTAIADAKALLEKQQQFWDYDNIMLIDADGKAYNLTSGDVFVSLDNEMRKGILDGKQTMSTTQIINNKEYILFSVPMNDIEIEGKTMVALAVSYSPASFDKVLSMSSFNEQAYSQIVTTRGTVVVRSSSAYAIKSGYNIFSTLQRAVLDDGETLADVQSGLAANGTGQISFTLDGVQSYMVYTPIAPEDWYLLTFVPVEVVNQKSDLLLQSTLLICGLIAVTFAALAASLVMLFNRHKRKLEQIAYVDDVTGGNTIQRFYELAGDALYTAQGTQYAIIYTNVEKFKVLNEQIGRQNCDAVLKFFSNYIGTQLHGRECMGRLSADNFCILAEFTNEAELLNRFGAWHLDAERLAESEKLAWSLPMMEFGIYVIENVALPFTQMIDRAKLALKESTRTVDSKLRCAFYDDAVRRQLFRDKQLEDRMESALANGEFQVYLQPKYRLPEEKIGGAEALVRWQSPDEGMIYPDEFIPLFEKNGFIIQVDIFVFETVCKTFCAWKKKGWTPVKVSVNCSRLHFRDPGFLAPYIRIADQYQLDRSLVEIELTESMVLQDSDQLIRIIDEIHDAGFGCSMDDFGSGYSSLNLLQTIPVDTLKLDKIFFQSKGASTQRTEAVIKNVISLAKALSLTTVAEGVEEPEQVSMLKRTGCDYIQGYVFARPMKISAFEELAFRD